MQFHRDVIAPDLSRQLDERLGALRTELRNDFYGALDAFAMRMERVETELAAVTMGLKRVEDRLDALEQRASSVEQKFEAMALRSEIVELRDHIAQLEQRIAQLEKQQN
jgi:predicted  nucleic acid-binding Zn-ribbon protein